MRSLDVLLNVVIVLAVTLFFSYVAFYYYGIGLLASLPAEVKGWFLDHSAIHYVTLVILVAAVIGKIAVGRAMRRRARSET